MMNLQKYLPSINMTKTILLPPSSQGQSIHTGGPPSSRNFMWCFCLPIYVIKFTYSIHTINTDFKYT